ncbi:uncharacterized protein LOC143292457 isoform X1 [Babylonia areolata]|uniref:uncharacterized protein LOC143292457 isoform X1 n=1 Tax=Babylonia areolata TaxID=304850 RepID=UPI003FD2E3BB
MVLTDLPFERGKLLHKRYEVIRRSESAPPAEETPSEAGKESKEYAAFLKGQERRVGPEGFLDSSRYTHTFQLKKDKETKAPAAGKGKVRSSSDTSAPSTVVSLTARVEKDMKDYQKRIKVVEDHMWQHKQEERELKRVEGDIIKNQRAVRHTLRDFGTAINKKRMAEDKKLNQSLERFTDMQREHTHKKHELTRQRAEKVIASLQDSKQQDRKTVLNINDLARQYQQKLSALELKRVEVMRLSHDFESKMRSKEEEQHKLKSELAELAITLNMVAQKGRVQKFDHSKTEKKETTQRINNDLESDKNLDNRMQRSDGDVKGAEMTKRKLSADLALTKAHLDIKKRDEQRHLTDTQIRLEDNTNVQRQLNETARHADMDLKAKQIDQRLEAHNAKRVQRLQTSMKSKKEKEDAQQEVWEARFKARSLEADRKKHEDSLKFFTKMVTKNEEREQSLYGSVRESEYARQKKDQEVRRLQQQLLAVRARNQERLKQEQIKVSQNEKELEQLLLKEKAELGKLHARREESYMQLQSHRFKMKEDKHLLEEHEREHNRLLKIGTRTELNPEMY